MVAFDMEGIEPQGRFHRKKMAVSFVIRVKDFPYYCSPNLGFAARRQIHR
jgi:hypothetical protein